MSYKSLLNSFEELSNNNTSNQFPYTGWENFDNEFQAFSTPGLHIIGGRPGMGKSTVLRSIAINLSKNRPIGFVSLANNTKEISKSFLHHFKNESKEDILISASELNLSILGIPNNDEEYITSQLEKIVTEKKVNTILLDDIQFIEFNEKKIQDYPLAYGNWYKSLHFWALSNNIVLIATSQLTRAVEFRGGSREPILSDLRGSGRLEEIAESIVFIVRLDYYTIFQDEEGVDRQNQMKFIVAKNANGYTGKCWLCCKDIPGQIKESVPNYPF